ncbi:MAG: molybdopterin-binding protein [Deltaproteobacteria bacterium]|nr:molybdopterin-binding protein [Deltaproteobacteria bacterium]
MYKTIKIEDAIGTILAHDITEIRKGEFKGRAFKKGQRISSEDVDHLRRLGKEHVYVLEPTPGYLHENDAAVFLADAFCGPGVYWEGEPNEGKIHLRAETKGVLKVSIEGLRKIHQMGEIICSTIHTNTVVDKGYIVASTRAIPLVIQETLVQEACAISREYNGILQVRPMRSANVGIVITGNEVFHGRVKDQFEPIFREKIDAIGSKILGVSFAPDHMDVIKEKIADLLDLGADLIITSGGMSVDPDDVTRLAIKQAGAKDIVYGAPVLPGAMFLVAYIHDVPVLGVPAGAIFYQTSMFDLVLPRVLAGERFTRETIAEMGHGGLCLFCSKCRYPICPFGK